MTLSKVKTHGLFAILIVLVLAACAAPTPETPAPGASAQTEPAPRMATMPAPARTKPAPPMSDPLPPEVMPMPASTTKPPVIDQSCKTSADCVVKDVGSCCGAMPACVNRNSAVPNPAVVQAQCAREGRVSTCMSNPITACLCANGQCVSEQEPVGGWINGAPPPQTDR
ncbi:MAG: hypothetical protein LH470_06435 [Lysobacter sp.]|nr:hypothetical protein [Lysobacter sp.]